MLISLEKLVASEENFRRNTRRRSIGGVEETNPRSPFVDVRNEVLALLIEYEDEP